MINVAGIPLRERIMNGAGSAKQVEDVLILAKTPIDVIVVGSITLAESPGNSGDVVWHGPYFSSNAIGLKNGGAEFYQQELPGMHTIAHDADKLLAVSVAGKTAEEFAILADMVMLRGADIIELNLGCPNVWDGVIQKPIACFDLEYVQEILELVTGKVGHGATIALKLSPFTDPRALQRLAAVINASPLVKIVVTTNTYPNALVFENRKPVLSTKNGYGGMSGIAMKPIGLGQVRQWRQSLDPRILIFGVGGIEGAEDVREYFEVEADAVQIVTHYLKNGPEVFQIIVDELNVTA